MSDTVTKPNEIENISTGNDTGDSQYNLNFGLIAKDGSGNPPTDVNVDSRKLYYNKDLDLVQNMRNLFSLTAGFKKTIDDMLAASGYGGWSLMTEFIHPDDRIPSVMYLNVLDIYTDPVQNITDSAGNDLPIYKIRAEIVQVNPDTGERSLQILKFSSDADQVHYDTSDSYALTETNVKGALDELSHRSIILKCTLRGNGWQESKQVSHTGTDFKETLWYQYVNVEGMEVTDYPIVTLNTDGNKLENISSTSNGTALSHAQVEASSLITRIQTLHNKICAYCYGEYHPTVDIPLVFRVLRGCDPNISL